MTNLLYRGQAYVMRKLSDDQPRIQLTYLSQHYITSRERVRAEMQEHQTLVYRGVS